MPIFKKAKQPFFINQLLYCCGFREADFNSDIIVLTDRFNKLIGFRMQTTCIQTKYTKGFAKA